MARMQQWEVIMSRQETLYFPPQKILENKWFLVKVLVFKTNQEKSEEMMHGLFVENLFKDQ